MEFMSNVDHNLGRFNQAEQNGDRNGRVAGEEQPREDAAAQRETRR